MQLVSAKFGMIVLLASLAVVLGACSGVPSGASSASAAAPMSSASPLGAMGSTAAGSTGSPAAGVVSCSAASLVAQGGRQGESGIAHGDVAFTNAGDAPCSLAGAPAAVALLRADGTQLQVTLMPPTSSAGPLIVLKPGVEQAAWLVVYWANWCAAGPGPLRIRITLGGGRGTVSAPFDGPPDYDYVPRCDQPDQPSTLQSDTFGPGG